MPGNDGRWQKGESGNPAGKQVGKRDRINEEFVRDLTADWQKGGLGALQKAREDRPAEYCRMVAGLLPKDQNLKIESSTDSLFSQLLESLPADEIRKENTRLKAEIAALKGETPEDEPETTTDASAVH